jgi:7-keto-8-aminopelargonate synthetase-like enzyme
MQTAVVSRAFDMIFSAEGDRLRAALMLNILALRKCMEIQGMTVAGIPSPIVPVYVGDERIARLTSKHLMRSGLLANLVEFPAVPTGRARFRFQVMANHERAAIQRAAELMSGSKAQAEAEWIRISGGG